MAQQHAVAPSTIHKWYAGELYLPANPAPIVAVGWKNNVGRSCIINDAKHDASGFTLTYSLIAAEAGGWTTYWGARLYNVHGARITDCEFGPVDREHTLYWESWGDNLIEDCWFHDAPAQAFQDALRGPLAKQGNETLNQDAPNVVGTLTMRHVRVDNCGLIAGAGRAAFALSFFEAEGFVGNNGRRMQSVYLDDITMTHRGEASGQITCSNRPAFIAHGLDIHYALCVTWVWNDATGSFTAKHREAMLFQDNDRVELAGYMDGSDIKFVNCKAIDTKSLKGNGSNWIFVDGKKVALVGSGYSH